MSTNLITLTWTGAIISDEIVDIMCDTLNTQAIPLKSLILENAQISDGKKAQLKECADSKNIELKF